MIQSARPGSSLTVRFLAITGVVIAIIIATLFYWMAKRQEAQIINQVDQQARVLFQQIVLTRSWAASQGGGGVYSEVTDAVQPNPYLLQVDGLTVNINSEEGKAYTLRNPALITRELSELAEKEGNYAFHITSLKLFNPNNTPTTWEADSLKRFESGEEKESFIIETTDEGAEVYRYMAPLYIKESCLLCHSSQGYKVGDVRGGISVTIPMNEARAAIQSNNQQLFVIGISLIVFVLAILWLLVYSQILQPLNKLQKYAVALSEGDLNIQAPIQSQDEIGNLAEAFNKMTSQLRDSIGTLEQRVSDRTKALTTSTAVSRRLSTILDRKELVEEVVELVNKSFGYYHTQIYFFDPGTENLIMAGGTGEAGRMLLAQFHKVRKGKGLVGRAAMTNQVVLVPDTAQSSEWLPNPLLSETRAEVAIPISTGDEVLGVLDVQHNVRNGLQQEDVDSLSSIATQIAIALQNIRQYENTRKIASDMGVVATVGISTSTISDARQLLQEVVDLSKKSFNLYHAHIYLLNETEEMLELTAGAGDVGRKMVSEKHKIPLNREQSLVARAARNREGVVVNDVTEAPDFLPNPLLPNTRAEMAVPMIVADKVIGVLDVQSETIGRFTEVDVNIQTTLASQVAVALQNARSFAQSQQQAERETAVNLITQKIQSATSVEAALQIAARELGHALGRKSTMVMIEPEALAGASRASATDQEDTPREIESMGTGVSS
ncbi:MAG: GAF domain-containing protein [Anaerolineales bacterium]|nr:GAF domain-containing protein [Anaerolineales bacterium]